jgi:tRNA dimethylallyltransferase
MVSAKKTEILVIVGETASGKSELAFRVAKQFNGEIISADSWMVYRGFDIGTAKPSKAEQSSIKHHLIDVAEPLDGFSAPLFKRQAEAAISGIFNRGKLPVLVGGTGLYIDSLLFDYGFLPAASKQERELLDRLELNELIVQAKNQQIDLAGVDLRNKRRIIRAIEASGQKPSKKPLRKDVLVIGLAPPPEELKTRIEARVKQMISDGLEEEVKRLAQLYGWQAEPMKGIGYREWQAYFEAGQSLQKTKERIISGTINLAKKQRTWFRRNKFIHWFSDVDSALKEVKKLLNK